MALLCKARVVTAGWREGDGYFCIAALRFHFVFVGAKAFGNRNGWCSFSFLSRYSRRQAGGLTRLIPYTVRCARHWA
jgi:hypothetical protein